jgi:hypothetical protein
VTEKEKLDRDIETLLDSIKSDWVEMANPLLTREQRQGIRNHIKSCLDELPDLLSRQEALDA